jgi:2-polyprenyl-3-methyl-5-hydroxy-6-metoxy-1,4-benzoquinol methylase
MDQVLTFDRTKDVSKLDGCNTRGNKYRWNVFRRHLQAVPGGTALDFGAGSLRESFELASLGFEVTSVDIDGPTLDAYKAQYDWPAAPRLIADGDMLSALLRLETRKFALITCFDVLEHLEDPTSALTSLSEHLADDGLLFVTVPNGRTLFEIAWRIETSSSQEQPAGIFDRASLTYREIPLPAGETSSAEPVFLSSITKCRSAFSRTIQQLLFRCR